MQNVFILISLNFILTLFFSSLHFCLFPAKLTPELPYKVLCSGKESPQDYMQSGTLAVTAAHTPPRPNPILCFPANVQLRSRSQVKIQPLWNVYKMRYNLQTAMGSHTKKQRPGGRGQGGECGETLTGLQETACGCQGSLMWSHCSSSPSGILCCFLFL